MVKGTYKGHPEEDPGKMKFRYKGFFKKEANARAAQKTLTGQGLKTKVVKYTDGYALYVMSKHDFWKKNFIYTPGE